MDGHPSASTRTAVTVLGLSGEGARSSLDLTLRTAVILA